MHSASSGLIIGIMKTTTAQLTSLILSLICWLAICPQVNAGGLLTSPSEDEPPPVVEQQPAAAEQKKTDENPPAKDTDAKEKKTAKKKKQKDDKSSDVKAKSGARTDDAKNPDVKKADSDADKQKKADDAKQKKADKKKKSEDKAAADKDDDKTADTTEKKEDAPATALDGTPKPKSTVPLPKRLASFTTGAVLGYPVAMAKRTVHQTKAGNRDFIGDSTNPIKVGIATIVSFPFGFVGGMFEGAQYSVYNSWKGSGEEPFGKSTFSLSDD